MTAIDKFRTYVRETGPVVIVITLLILTAWGAFLLGERDARRDRARLIDEIVTMESVNAINDVSRASRSLYRDRQGNEASPCTPTRDCWPSSVSELYPALDMETRYRVSPSGELMTRTDEIVILRRVDELLAITVTTPSPYMGSFLFDHFPEETWSSSLSTGETRNYKFTVYIGVSEPIYE